MRDVPVTGRAPAPDLARGAALLLIAVANAHTFVTHRGIGVRAYPLDPTGVDAWLAAAQLTLVDGRAYPLFALLFGYGIAGLARRAARDGAGPDQVLALVRRRGGALFAVGAAHAVLLWHGDFVAAYGLIAVVLAPVLVRGSAAVLVLTGVAAATLLALLYAPVALTRSDAPSASPSLVAPDVLSAAVERFGEWLFGNLLISAVGLLGAAAAGVLVARAGWLDAPARHRRALRRVAVAGIGAGVVGGLPLGLVAAGVWTPSEPVALVVGVLHAVTGYAAGAGYAALAGLVVARWSRSADGARRAVGHVSAAGRRGPGPGWVGGPRPGRAGAALAERVPGAVGGVRGPVPGLDARARRGPAAVGGDAVRGRGVAGDRRRRRGGRAPWPPRTGRGAAAAADLRPIPGSGTPPRRTMIAGSAVPDAPRCARHSTPGDRRAARPGPRGGWRSRLPT